VNDYSEAGGQAFPGTHVVDSSDYSCMRSRGMSLLDYFAAAALPAIIQVLENHEGPFSADQHARCAYAYAEAMVMERERRGKL
jgi:hypothetical protein